MNRFDISKLILSKFKNITFEYLKNQYAESGPINHIVIDELLPREIALKLNDLFPNESELNHIKGVQENKFVGVNFSKSQNLIEECIYSFQEPLVIDAISKITRIKELIGDPELYAGGISSMSEGCFLNPHIDNSHDRNLENFRRLNLLYYVNKDWISSDSGGDLILYPKGIRKGEIQIPCKFNRLVIMKTDNRSLHGVRKVTTKNNRRKCLSNYYFSKKSPLDKEYYHSTSFRGFKKEYIKGTILELNALSRTLAKNIFYKLSGKSISTNLHKRIDKK